MDLYYKIRRAISSFWYDLRVRCQRFKRGYSYSDVWDMDYWFIHTVKPMLIHLRDYGIGTPGEIYNHDGEDGRINWKNILTEMIDCLDLMEEDAAQEHLGVADNDYSVESYNKVTDLMHEKKDRFFELFSEHFYALWD